MDKPIKLNEIPKEILNYCGSIELLRFPRQGWTSDVGIIETSQGHYVLKRTKGEQYCSWLSREVFVLNSLNQNTNLPVPKVFKFIEEKNPIQSWALIEFYEGETLRTSLANENDEEKRQKMIFNFGRILAKIHSTPCPKELIGEEDWLDETLAKAEYNLKHYEVDGNKDLLENLKANKPKKFRKTLIHGDFTIDNVLVQNGEITSIIDWSGGAYGDPRYDASLAVRPKHNAFESKKDKEIFFEGYGEQIITEEDYEYFENGIYEFF